MEQHVLHKNELNTNIQSKSTNDVKSQAKHTSTIEQFTSMPLGTVCRSQQPSLGGTCRMKESDNKYIESGDWTAYPPV